VVYDGADWLAQEVVTYTRAAEKQTAADCKFGGGGEGSGRSAARASGAPVVALVMLMLFLVLLHFGVQLVCLLFLFGGQNAAGL
jgi:hypothetical protein